LHIVAKEAAKILGASLVVIFLKIKGKDEAKLLGEYAKEPIHKSQIGQVHKLDESHPITSYILKRGKTFICSDTKKLIPKLPKSAQKGLEGSQVKAFIGLPLRYQNKIVGAIVFDDTDNVRKFSKEEVIIAKIIAEQSAAAIAKAQRIEEVIQLKNQLQRMSSELLGKRLISESKKSAKEKFSKTVHIPPKRTKVTIVCMRLQDVAKFEGKNDVYKVASMYEEFYKLTQDIHDKFKGVFYEIKGDEILLNFRQPLYALQAATSLLKHLQKMTNTYGITVGISIHTGNVLIGFIKSKQRKFYMLTGKAIQIVRHLQTYSREGEIVVSEQTYKELSESQRKEFAFSDKIKGKIEGYSKSFSYYHLE